MPIATTPEQLALQASIRDWAKQAGPLAAVRRLEPSPAAVAPAGFGSDLGLSSIPVPGQAGERVLGLPREPR